MNMYLKSSFRVKEMLPEYSSLLMVLILSQFLKNSSQSIKFYIGNSDEKSQLMLGVRRANRQ